MLSTMLCTLIIASTPHRQVIEADGTRIETNGAQRVYRCLRVREDVRAVDESRPLRTFKVVPETVQTASAQ